MNICLIMPTCRWWNWKRLIANYQSCLEPGVNLRWMPIIYQDEFESFPALALDEICDPRADLGFAITPLVIDRPDGDVQVFITHKNNEALTKLGAEGFDGWIGTYSDDNLMPRCFCRRWREGAHKPIIVCSHKRGQRPGASGHRTYDLIAAPKNMMVGEVSGEQYLIHSKACSRIRLSPGSCGDGILITSLWLHRPNDFHYIPDFFIPFNALEEGRWDGDSLEACLNVS